MLCIYKMIKGGNRFVFLYLLCVLLAPCSLPLRAQCSAENTAFLPGEELTYDLFFNWKFIWVNAGSATMNIQETMWEGQPAYKGYLITRTSERLDRFFMMRDTLNCIIAPDMTPLYFKKGANEGGRYYDFPELRIGNAIILCRYHCKLHGKPIVFL